MGKRKKIPDALDCTMSLGDHLEELRARLILALLGLFVGVVVALILGKHIIRFIELPYVWAMEKRVTKTEPEIAAAVEPNEIAFVEIFFSKLAMSLATDPNAPDIDPNRLAFFQSVAADAVREWVAPPEEVKPEKKGGLPRYARLQTLAPAEAFISYMKISFIAGLLLTCPWVFHQLWMFVAAGLYEHERKYVRTAVPFSAALFIAGALFFLFVIARLSMNFFLFFGDTLGVSSNWTLQRYISFVTLLMLVFGIGFQTPIAIFILVRTGLVSLVTLRSIRKYVVLGMVIISAVATPPDIVSQIALAVPLYLLYELGMLLAHFASKRATEAEESESTSD